MKFTGIALGLIFLASPIFAEDQPPQGPSNEKAQKTYKDALEYLYRREIISAYEAFKKADKQDDGRCRACQRQIIKYGQEFQDWKALEIVGAEMIAEAQGPKEVALAHYELGVLLIDEGTDRHKEEILERAHQEMIKALATVPKFPDAVLSDGQILAHLHQDGAAKERFQQFVKMMPAESPARQRALRYISEPDLARARTVPAFAVETIDGQRMSLDDLQGKVVLIDFWATWCGPCMAALPHIRSIAKKFEGQPLVVLSISVDTNQAKWKEFVAKNEMTWPQAFDGGFNGKVARAFGVHAIPNTFTVDADGVLQDEHTGDGSIEGKLKKLVKRAEEVRAAKAAGSEVQP